MRIYTYICIASFAICVRVTNSKLPRFSFCVDNSYLFPLMLISLRAFMTVDELLQLSMLGLQ